MKRRLMNNVGLKMLAFLSAFILWLMVVNIDDPVKTETYHNIPVTVVNEEVLAESNQTYQIVDDTQTVSVTVSAHRSVLDKIKSEDIAAIADMKELTLNTQIPLTVLISGREGDYNEAYTSPRNLQIKLEEEQTKKFPIVPTTTGTVRDGNALGEIKAVPEMVSIRGPVSVISKISRVEAEVSVSGLSSDTVLPSQLVLYDDENNVVDQTRLTNNLGVDGIAVSVQILNTKGIPLSFDISGVTAAEGYSISGVTYEPQEVQVAGVNEELKSIKEIEIPSSALELSDLTSKTEQVVDITDYIPETINLVDANMGSIVVTISVEKDGTKTYEVSVGSVVVNGLDEKLIMRYETVDVIQVQVRGPAVLLDSVAVDKNISIDLSNYRKPGSYRVPVNVVLPDGCRLEQGISLGVILEEK